MNKKLNNEMIGKKIVCVSDDARYFVNGQLANPAWHKGSEKIIQKIDIDKGLIMLDEDLTA